MRRLRKGLYLLYFASFLTPDLDLGLVGFQLAVDAVVGGVSGLLEGPSRLVFSLYGLSLFFLNFSLIPDIHLKKWFRIIIAVWPWSVAFMPQVVSNDEVILFVTVPPFLMWAISISSINIISVSKERS